MRAHVIVRLPDGTTHIAGHGDFIGRLAGAAIHIDDARVSEAHAMVSLRGDELWLLGLRGRFAVDNRPADKVLLRQDLTVYLARDLPLVIEDVVMPGGALALRSETLGTRVLPNVASLVLEPDPVLESRYRSQARATFWTTGKAWRYRIGDEPAADLEAGTRFDIDGVTYEVVLMALAQAGGQATRREGELYEPLVITTMFDAVHIESQGTPPLALSGIPARILSELNEIGQPVSWEAVAGQLWTGLERTQLRRRWDLSLGRFQKKLREAGFRQDLVVPDGNGNVHLLLYPGDTCIDAS